MENNQEKKVITVSGVLAMLDAGKSRQEIKEELELSHMEMAELFKHPKLKNKKAKRQVSFELLDDTVEEDLVEENTEEENTTDAWGDAPVGEDESPEAVESESSEEDNDIFAQYAVE